MVQRRASAARATTPESGTTLAARRLDALVRRFVFAHGPGFGAGWSRSLAMGRDTMKHTFDTDVLVNIRPAHSLTGPDKAKIRALLWRGSR